MSSGIISNLQRFTHLMLFLPSEFSPLQVPPVIVPLGISTVLKADIARKFGKTPLEFHPNLTVVLINFDLYVLFS